MGRSVARPATANRPSAPAARDTGSCGLMPNRAPQARSRRSAQRRPAVGGQTRLQAFEHFADPTAGSAVVSPWPVLFHSSHHRLVGNLLEGRLSHNSPFTTY
jgi:hypothetical protein